MIHFCAYFPLAQILTLNLIDKSQSYILLYL